MTPIFTLAADIFTYTNVSVNSHTIEIEQLVDGVFTPFLITPAIDSENTTSFTLAEGFNYKFTILASGLTSSSTVFYYLYDTKALSLVTREATKIICGCGCKASPCKKEQDCDELLFSLFQVLSFFFRGHQQHNPIYATIYTFFIQKFKVDLQCNLSNLHLNGSILSREHITTYLTTMFYAIYTAQVAVVASSVIEIEEIKECMKLLGLRGVEELDVLLEETHTIVGEGGGGGPGGIEIPIEEEPGGPVIVPE